MLFHLSAFSVIVVVLFRTSSLCDPFRLVPRRRADPPVLIVYRTRLLPVLSPYLPSALVARLSNYQPLNSFAFTDQAAAGMSSRNFDLEENLGEGSGENRTGLDEGGVEEVRRIM